MLSAAVLAAIVLPIFVLLMLYLPGVQNFAVDRAARWASQKVGTTVTVGTLHWKLFNRLEVTDVYAEDYQGDTLFFVGRLEVSVRDFGLLGGKTRLGGVKLSDSGLYLKDGESGKLNISEITSRLKSDKEKKNKGDFRMAIASVEIDNFAFRYSRREVEQKEFGMNFRDIGADSIRIKLEDIDIFNDSISARIDRIACLEKSGFELDRLSAGAFRISGSGMLFDDLRIETPASEIRMDYLRFLYPSWRAYNSFIDQVRIQSSIAPSQISFSTISYFAQALRGWETSLRTFEATVDGPIAALGVDIRQAATRSTDLSGRFRIDGIPDPKAMRFRFEVERLITNASDVEAIVADITRSQPAWASKLQPLGDIALHGDFEGLFTDFRSEAQVVTDLGSALFDVVMKPDAGGRHKVHGHTRIDGFDAGKLLGEKTLGRTSLEADIDGWFREKELHLNTSAAISELHYAGYTYNRLHAKGLVDNNTFTGEASSTDPNLTFDFDGRVELANEKPSYDFRLALERADLARLGINRRDSVSVLRCRVTARGEGRTLDDLNGTVEIDDMLYVNQLDSVRTGKITLRGVNSDASKMLGMNSSFADAEFRSSMSYSELINHMRRTFLSYLPALTDPRKETPAPAAGSGEAKANLYSTLKINVKQANNVAGIFMPGLKVAQGSQLSLLLNPAADKFSLSVHSDYLDSEEFLVTKLSLDSRNDGDSISVYLRADDLYKGRFHTPDLAIIGGVRRDRANLSARFSDSKGGELSLLALSALFRRDSLTHALRTTVRVQPSSLVIGDKRWRVLSRDITIDSARVVVDNFRITAPGEELSVYGIASRNRRDTLHVRLSNFDLRPLSRITSPEGYTLSGVTNGYADMVSALGGGVLYARIAFDDMKINSTAVPASLFESRWDFAGERARFLFSRRESGDTILLGYYRPTDRRYRADIKLRNLDLALLNPVLEDVTSDFRGMVDANLMLIGVGGNATLSGRVDVRDISARVDFTNVTYTAPAGTIDVKDNVLRMQPMKLRDPRGESADFEMTLDLRNLRNIAYDIGIKPRNVLALNTTEADNNAFYGKVYASGTMTVRGDKRGTVMNINATTDDNSEFFMPLRATGDLAEADFIQFATPTARIDTTDYLVRRRMVFERGENRKGDAQRGEMNINMALNVRPNTEIQLVIDPKVGDIVRARGNGVFNIHVAPRSNEFTLYGDYEINEGSYLFTLQNVINKRFIIEPGSAIRWMGDPVDAQLDINAVYKLKASIAPLLGTSSTGSGQRRVPVDCYIHLTDRLTQPMTTFDVQLPNVDPETQSLVTNVLNTQEMKATQFFWLLAANSFFVESASSMQNIGAMGGSVTGFEFLSNQVSNWISSDRYNIGFHYRPKSDFTSDEVDFSYSTGLVDDRLLIEVDGNYDFGNNAAATANSSVSNLSGINVSATWLVDRNGNLRAKAFTRTIDTFDENQGLPESGAGLDYKEDFNRFSDIIRNLRERFKRKNRKAAAEQEITDTNNNK